MQAQCNNTPSICPHFFFNASPFLLKGNHLIDSVDGIVDFVKLVQLFPYVILIEGEPSLPYG